MIIVLRSDFVGEAEALIAAEPYKQAGGFSASSIRLWSQVLPAEPGALQRTLMEERAK